jgi:hypothetical protein
LKRVPVKFRKIGAKKSGKPIPSWRFGNVPPSQAIWEKFEYQSLYDRAESGIEHPLSEERSIEGSSGFGKHIRTLGRVEGSAFRTHGIIEIIPERTKAPFVQARNYQQVKLLPFHMPSAAPTAPTSDLVDNFIIGHLRHLLRIVSLTDAETSQLVGTGCEPQFLVGDHCQILKKDALRRSGY